LRFRDLEKKGGEKESVNNENNYILFIVSENEQLNCTKEEKKILPINMHLY